MLYWKLPSDMGGVVWNVVKASSSEGGATSKPREI
jgi:hypothetical protein